MRKAEYPQRSCRLPVAGEHSDFPCEVAGEWHAGPHASYSVPGSVQRRDEWEAQNPGWEKMGGQLGDPFREIKP